MKTLNEILKDAQYCRCWYLRSSIPSYSILEYRFREIGVNEECWLIEDDNGNPIYSKFDVGRMYLGVNEMVKICFEI